MIKTVKAQFIYGETCWVLVNGKAVADARIFKYGNLLLVDDLMVYEDHRRMGYGSILVTELKKVCKKNGWMFGAYGIIKTERAQKFWAKHGVYDYFNELEKAG